VRAKVEEKRAGTTIRIFIMTEIRVIQLSETIKLVNINIHLTAIDYSLLYAIALHVSVSTTNFKRECMQFETNLNVLKIYF